MNDIEFETMARRAASAVRNEAEQIADSRSTLATLLAADGDVPRGRADTSTVVELTERGEHTDRAGRAGRRRPAWMPILAAAAALVVVAGIVLVATRDDESGMVVTTEPTVPQATTPEVTTPSVQTVPSTVPEAAPATTPSTDPPDDAPVLVTDLPGPALERTVLATYERGDGAGALGFESCQECEPVRPWAPIVTADGTLLVADAFNDRWQIHRDGAWTSLPHRPGEVVVASPVVGHDGLVYAMVADDLSGRSGVQVVAYDPQTMDIAATYPGGDTAYGSVDLVNDEIQVGGRVVTTIDTPLGTPTWELVGQTGEVTLSVSGVQRRFQLPADWSISNGHTASLADGSLVLHVVVPNEGGTSDWSIVRLWADGSFATGSIPTNPGTTDLLGRVTSTGWVQLEDSIVEYALPEFVGPDPLAGWFAPELLGATVNDVPLLLPQPLPSAATTLRDEGASPSAGGSYLQHWVRSDATGRVDGIVQITTRFNPALVSSGAAEVVVDGWPVASFRRTSDDVVSLDLRSATRSVDIWTSGLDRDAVADLANSLQVDADGTGWASDVLAPQADWTIVNEGWDIGSAARTLQQRAAGDVLTFEMQIVVGSPAAILTPGQVGLDIELRSIGGRPALLFDRGGGNAAVTWSPSDGVVVGIGEQSVPDTVFDTASGVGTVDQATWEAASVLDTTSGDGCDSMFC